MIWMLSIVKVTTCGLTSSKVRPERLLFWEKKTQSLRLQLWIRQSFQLVLFLLLIWWSNVRNVASASNERQHIQHCDTSLISSKRFVLSKVIISSNIKSSAYSTRSVAILHQVCRLKIYNTCITNEIRGHYKGKTWVDILCSLKHLGIGIHSALRYFSHNIIYRPFSVKDTNLDCKRQDY